MAALNTMSLPHSFGRYQLIQEVGVGGMARVYRAEMQGPGGFSKVVAVKRIHPHLVARNPRFVKLFISEARLGGYLNHPNILQTLDFGEIDNLLFITMEFVDGPSMAQLLSACRKARRPIPPEIALELIFQATAGVGSAHHSVDSSGNALNMIHRDIKPSNLMLSRLGHVKVADFGVARAESNLLKTAMTGALRGTVSYMAPEQAWGQRDLDQRADLFSLSAILYELLTLRRLYPGKHPAKVLRLAQDGDYGDFQTFIPKIPLRSDIIRLLRVGLAAKRENRFGDAGEMHSALEQVLLRLPRPRIAQWLQGVLNDDTLIANDEKHSTMLNLGEELSLASDPIKADSPKLERPTQVESPFPKELPSHQRHTQKGPSLNAFAHMHSASPNPVLKDDPWADAATSVMPKMAPLDSFENDPEFEPTMPLPAKNPVVQLNLHPTSPPISDEITVEQALEPAPAFVPSKPMASLEDDDTLIMVSSSSTKTRPKTAQLAVASPPQKKRAVQSLGGRVPYLALLLIVSLFALFWLIFF